MRNLFILFLFFSFVDSFHSQVIDFAVLDSVNHFPVEHVQCIVNSNTYWSDENGYVRISREKTNWTTIELVAQGYISKKYPRILLSKTSRNWFIWHLKFQVFRKLKYTLQPINPYSSN